jgi:tetratricopeptide (TPR) repeat protein
MRWQQSEYILKGVYLGLLVFVALQEPDWQDVARVALCTLGGLAVCLGLAAIGKLREGYRVSGRVLPFILFLLLESPRLVFAGIVLGMLAGAIWVRNPNAPSMQLSLAVLGGGAVGFAFYLMRHVRHRWGRFGLSLALGVAAVAGTVYWLDHYPDILQEPRLFAVHLLLGIPLFYLLTFAAEAEESEVEIGAMCAGLGVGVWLLKLTPNFQPLAFLLPLFIFYWYTTRVLPGLRVFKHTVRGISYANIGQYRPALLAFRRALQLDPNNHLAREGLWAVHRKMDLGAVADDPDTLALVDFDLCLERAGSLLLNPGPSQAMREEAHRLLDLVAAHRPAMRSAVDYWRAVALLHARQYEQAAACLERVLDPTQPDAANPHRQAILLNAWQLALTLHPEMHKRVGSVQLPQPGRRMEAIAAVERHLADNADDRSVWELKRLLYSGLTEAEYDAAAKGAQPLSHFDYGYAQQLGLALINDNTHWQRGAAYLRMAAHGMPVMGPSIFTQIAQAHERNNNADAARHNYELAIRAGRAVGPKNLGDEDRHAFFATVKKMADDASTRNDLATAIEYYHLYSEYERSGLETLRLLADLYERKGDPLSALRVNEQALVYDGTNKELLERKDKYYYSVLPEDLKARLDSVRGAFDTAYCLSKARSLLNIRDVPLDLIDWAEHLLVLALVVQPDNRPAKVLRARAHLYRGERDQAVALLEEVRNPRPEKFAGADDEEAWFQSCQMLGKLYLDELGKPEEAVKCLQDFRKSPKSGADTLYRLGAAYEALGDPARAAKFYEQVTAYDGHPLAPDARDALYRLQTR